jgi:hypothetical protein
MPLHIGWLLITAFLLFAPSKVQSQSPNIIWQNSIGGLVEDDLFTLLQTRNGSFILGGESWSGISGDKTESNFLYNDFWNVKVDSTGNIVWQNTIGGMGNDNFRAIDTTTDGGFIIGGYSNSEISGDKTETHLGVDDFSGDYWVLKLDSIGNVVWQNTIGGNSVDELFAIKQTLDGGYILGGESLSDSSFDKSENNKGFSDCWVVKLDSLGNIEWENSFGGTGTEHLFSLDISIDGGYIIGASSHSGIGEDKSEPNKGADDFWVLKLDESGNIIWDKTIGGDSWDIIRSIATTIDGNYIVFGYSNSGISGDKTEANFGYEDYWLIKLNQDGEVLWQNTIGGSSIDIGISVTQKNNGNYLIGGYSFSNTSGDKTDSLRGDSDFWIVELDSLGMILWDKTIGGDGKDLIANFIETSDGGYLVGGTGYCNLTGDMTDPGNGSTEFWIMKLCGDLTTITDSICRGSFYTLPDGDVVTESGVYTILLTNKNGCDSVVNINLELHEVNTLINFENGELVANDSLAIFYQWIDCTDNTLVEGANDFYYKPLSTGSYAVVLTDNFGCIDTSECYKVLVEDISPSTFSFDITIYPNPATNFLNIETNSQIPDAFIEIFTIDNKSVYSSKFISNKTSIKLPELPIGFYWLIIKTEFSFYYFKISII